MSGPAISIVPIYRLSYRYVGDCARHVVCGDRLEQHFGRGPGI
jgi:hypothetical protein